MEQRGQWWPFPHTAIVISLSGMASWQAGHCSVNSVALATPEESLGRRSCVATESARPSSVRSCGEPGRRDWTINLMMKGTSSADIGVSERRVREGERAYRLGRVRQLLHVGGECEVFSGISRSRYLEQPGRTRIDEPQSLRISVPHAIRIAQRFEVSENTYPNEVGQRQAHPQGRDFRPTEKMRRQALPEAAAYIVRKLHVQGRDNDLGGIILGRLLQHLKKTVVYRLKPSLVVKPEEERPEYTQRNRVVRCKASAKTYIA